MDANAVASGNSLVSDWARGEIGFGEIASAVHFLCLPEQGYLTGQIIHVNGGQFYGG